MNYDSMYPAYFFITLFVVFIVEVLVIYSAIRDDLRNIAKKGSQLIQAQFPMLTHKQEVALLEYKKHAPMVRTVVSSDADPVTKHFQFKDIHTLDLIFDVPEASIKDIDFTEDEATVPEVQKTFSDFLNKEQRKKISYFYFYYDGYNSFLNLVEKKTKWKSGIKKKVLVLSDVNPDKEVTFSHYLTYDKSELLDVIDPEIFWGVDICVAVTPKDELSLVKKTKVNEIFDKYDEVWIFEPSENESRVLNTLGLSDELDAHVETEAYEQ
jgi:hypothetical protein